MRKTKSMPKNKLIINKKQIIDDLWRKLQSSDNPAISVNRKSLKTIYDMLETTIMDYLSNTDLSYADLTVEIRPFRGLVIRRFTEPEETKVNNLTGKVYTKKERTRYCAYIPPYWVRSWNELDD